ncbi:hypothetical protein FQN55_008801 [Onygenales sp. PD_40]|nr:hypothetical protein FQN55_008801 [Onygenales sp. PD_40]
MAICITFGTHEFTSRLQGYENVTAQCHNCGNWSANCITRCLSAMVHSLLHSNDPMSSRKRAEAGLNNRQRRMGDLLAGDTVDQVKRRRSLLLSRGLGINK